VDAAPVLVADLDAAFSAAVVALVELAGLTALVVTTGVEAIRAARERRPSVIILDVGLRGMSAYETCRQLRETYGDTLPILFVSKDRTASLDRVVGLLIGADDYLTKSIHPDELLARIRRAAARSIAASRGAQPHGSAPPPAPDRAGSQAAAALTPRELEVLRLMAAGLTPRDISDRLVISPKTVSSHVQRILAKLAVHSRLQAVALAYEAGLVSVNGGVDGTAASARITAHASE
jgi:DNA-binding NarL/FixJ family response regulator